MLRNNADVRRCSYFELGLPVVRLFRINASESLEKHLARAIYKEEIWRNGEKKSSLQPKNP